MSAADVDGDGDIDVLGTAYYPSALYADVAWLENGGSGYFIHHTVAFDFEGAMSAYAVDLDSDGDIDILGAASVAGNIGWWENDGSQAFSFHSVASGFDGARSVYATDVDGDGDFDVLGAASDADEIAWWENDGSEGFSYHTIAGAFDGAHSVCAVDMDGDGDVDVLGAAFDGDEIAWWENDGQESFAFHLVASGFDGAASIQAVDLDEDGDVDLLGAAYNAAYGADKIAWWENDGDGGLAYHPITADFGSAYSAFATDLDQDGDVDVLGASYSAGIAWWENDGSEGFTAHTIDTDTIYAVSVCAADVNRDGDVDVLGAIYDLYNTLEYDDIAWWENDGSEGFSAHDVTKGADGARSVYATDVDGDGDTDVLGAAATDGLSWWQNDGEGDFYSHNIDEGVDFWDASSVYATDVDQDGDTDVLGAARYGNNIAWWENDGSQDFTVHVIESDFHWAYSVHAADVDGDGDVDVLGGADSRIGWWENDGSENFSYHEIDNGGAFSVAANDIDGDGDLDILAATLYGRIGWWANEGDGSFTAQLVGETGDPRSVQAVDVDTDGDIDVVSADNGADEIAWWENDGHEHFTRHAIDTGFDGAISAYATDVDGDGDVDVLGAAREGNQVAWWENDGHEGFARHTIEADFGDAYSVYTTDVDGDGDVDVLGAASSPGEVAWWEQVHFCEQVTEIPRGECDALVALHKATDGDQWSNSANWLLTNTPSDWYGVTVAGGHVTGLDLSDNGLDGSLPPRLGDLIALEYLDLATNRLEGRIPREIGELSNLTSLSLRYNRLRGNVPVELSNLSGLGELDVSYNALGCSGPAICAFLNDKDPGWSDTQTVPPTDVSAVPLSGSMVTLSWQPITYTQDGGYYQVSYGTASGGPYTASVTTTDKTASGLVVTGLLPTTVYYFVVRSFTPAHGSQQNDIWSEYGQETTATTLLPTFTRVNRSHDWVDGRSPVPNSEVEAVLLDAEGGTKGSGSVLSDEEGWFGTEFLDAGGSGVDVIAGDVVSVTIASSLLLTVEVVPMTGEVDPVANTISGIIGGATEGEQVQAEVWGLSDGPGAVVGSVQADGSYVLTRYGFDVRHGHQIAVWYRNDQGNSVGIVRHWLRIEAQADRSVVRGETAPDATVQMTVGRDGVVGAGTAVADAEGRYHAEIYSDTQPLAIWPGDRITVTADGRTSAMTVAQVTGVMDSDADTVCGDAPPNSEIRIDVWGEATIWHDVDTSGRYCVELDFDLQRDHEGEVTSFDTNRHNTVALLAHSERQVTPLSLGVTLDAAVAPLAYADYALEIEAGERLLVEVVPGEGADELWLYSQFGALPSRSQYDIRAQAPSARHKYDLLVAPTRSGTYYVSVYGWQVAGGQGNYTIQARTLDRYLSNVRPQLGGNTGPISVLLQGLGFVEGMDVELHRSGYPTLGAASVALFSDTELSAHVDLTGAPPGLYDVVLTWPGGATETIDDAFQVVAGGVGAQLEASLEVPEHVRPDRTYLLWLDYANAGDTDMLAPLFVISSTDHVPLRLYDHELFEDRPVQVLGINPDGYAGWLAPGASARIPVYLHVPPDTPGHAMLDFELAVMVSDTLPIDWDAVEAEVRPPDVDPEVWDALWPTLTAQIGDAWGDYRQALANDAGYLGALGRAVYGVRELFRYEVRKALGMHPRAVLAGRIDAYAPAPGMSLQFGRVFPGSLEGRFYLGPMGRGWSHSYDVRLEVLSDGDVRLRWPGAFSRLYVHNGDGTYGPLPGDHGTLTREGDVFTVTELDGTVYRFRADGRLDYVEEPNGNRITATYDGSDRLIEVQHSSGEGFVLGYNAHGRIATLTDHAGRETAFGYDASGEYLLSVTAPGSRVITYTYNALTGQPADHALRAIGYPDGTHQYYDYDPLGRLREERLDGGAERVGYTYDVYHRVHVTDAANETTVIAPDERGLPLRISDPLGDTLEQTYDERLDLSRLTDPAGQAYTFEHDLQGNVIEAENPLGHLVRLAYDAHFGQVAWLEDARGQESAFGYDDAGNLTSLTYPNGLSETIGYDPAGNPVTTTTRAGDTISYTHNARGQLTRADYPDGSWVAYTYDPRGNLTAATNPSGTIAMAYHPDTDWLTRIDYPTGHWFEYAYNDAGQRTQRRDQDGHELNYAYDAAGRLERLYDETGTDHIVYTYDDVGRLSREDKGNGTYTTYDYDEAGQLVSLINYAPDDSVQSRFDYTYDANGNRTSMATHRPGQGGPLEGTTTYVYDLIGQLVGVAYPDGRIVTYEYDAAGNRVTVTDDGVPTDYVANEMNQYTQVGDVAYTYDDNGNMTSKTDASGTTTYAYDYENRLIRVTTPLSGTWAYTYDALGNRAIVDHDGSVTCYVHDPAGLVDVAAEYDGTGVLVAQYVHGLGLVARIGALGDLAFYAYDATGHTRQVTDGSGTVANDYDYTPFGIPRQVIGIIPNLFRYVGRFGVVAEDNGLFFMRERFYDCSLGRFFSVDPMMSPLWNLYIYANNNPADRIDPLGLASRTSIDELIERTRHESKRSRKAGQELVRDSLDIIGSDPEPVDQFRKEVLRPSHGIISILEFIKTMVKLLEKAIEFEHNNPYYESASLVEVTDPPSQNVSQNVSENITSDDPNEKVGSTGVGSQRSVSVDEELYYVIYFENQPTAGAPAQEVFVTDDLDPSLDWSTLHLTEIAWGDQVISVPENTGDYYTRQTVADYRPDVGQSWWVDVEVETDYGSGQVGWMFRTLDPQTGDLPIDPLAGLLPPDDETGRGEGHVSFAVRPRVDIADGTIVANQASIVFDTNVPIVTNQVTNTVVAYTIVTSTADSGPGTLRQALLDADPGETIRFHPAVFKLSAPVTIALVSGLPAIVTDGLTIDGGDAGVILDGSGTPEWTSGLVVLGASEVTIQGLQILGFPGWGVELRGGATENTVGGVNAAPGWGCSGDCNVIGGNGHDGVYIAGTGTTSNTVSGNHVGVGANGVMAIGNGMTGVWIGDGAQGNVVGGDTPGERNVIGGNGADGIGISGAGTTGNVVKGNHIGTDAGGTEPLPNAVTGVYVGAGAGQNTVGVGNTIAFNGGDGVQVQGSDTLSNTITRNSICSNTAQGIYLGDGGNAGLAAPIITDFDLAGGVVTGTACAGCTVEVFSDDADEGRDYEGYAVANGAGGWTCSRGSSFAGPHLTATATDGAGNTSEFSDPVPSLNTPPVLSDLPDQLFDHVTSPPGTIELWAYASDAESDPSELAYTVEGPPPAGAGVTLSGTHEVIVDPSPNWCGGTDVTVRATDPDGLWDEDTFRVAVSWSCPGPVEMPGAPVLIAPVDGRAYSGSPVFAWHPVEGAETYRVQVDDDEGFSSPERDETTSVTEFALAAGLSGGTYRWRVRGVNGSEVGGWSGGWSFAVLAPSPPELKIYLPIAIRDYP